MTENTTPTTTATPDNFLAEQRIALGLSRKDLSDLTGITQAVIWRLEHVATQDVKATDVATRTTLVDALAAYKTANPNGKPKPAPKKSTTTVTQSIDPAKITDAFELLLAAITQEEATAKSKKGSTAPFARLLTVLDNAKAVAGL